MNPLISTTPLETIQNVSNALAALMVMLADTNSDLCMLLAPLQAAVDHAARSPSED